MGAMIRPVLRQITRWKSARFRVGAIVSSPISPITEEHSLFPSSFTCYSIRQPCSYPCPPYQPDATSGLPRSVQTTRLGRSCLFAGDTNVSVFAPSKQTTDHIESNAVAFGSSSLTAFNSSSLYVDHPTQPSASPGRNCRTHNETLADSTVPRRVATLSERSAPHRYQ